MSVPYAIAKLAFSLVMVFSYPLLCDPARSALDQLLAKMVVRGSAERLATWNGLYQFRHYTETFLLVAIPTAIAVFAANMAALFMDVFSSLCGSLLVFIFPSLYFIKLATPKMYNYRIHNWEKSLVAVNIFVGSAVAIIGTFDSVKNIVKAILR